ncbi:hypothetical protein [Crocosphaera sp.]|uniref:hypothetical protein n=1 Tax=Crocosphaera sp. TaxID=2729996 RepID=UPI002616EF43|nr:hypothetical protein [Crocosphaera sp.]MDJ0581469.1 hypothetical protein [Crocosphaera sp.]
MSNNYTKNTTLSIGLFEVFSDVNEPEIQFFLSYTGNKFNHCGICIRTTSFVSPEDVHKVIQISNNKDSDIGEIITDKMGEKILIASISTDPTISTYGESFTISTRNDKSLSSVFEELSDQNLISAIVEVMGCR